MQYIYKNAIQNKWIVQDNNLCDEHHNILIHHINNYLNNEQIKEINQHNCLLNAINPIYCKKGIYIKIPFYNQENQEKGIYHWYLVNDSEKGLYCNHQFVDYLDDYKTYQANISNLKNKLQDSTIYLNLGKDKDKLNNFQIGKWINDNYKLTNSPTIYNHVIYQEMSLEEFISQSLKILKSFALYNPEINKIPKFEFMLNWKE